MNDIIKKYKIPKKLVGAGDKEIAEWARNILLGEEPKLDKTTRTAIREGKITEILIEPKIPGTFLNGEFIPAYDYSPPIGGDLQEAEEEWDLEEELNEWANEENKRFNKEIWKKSNTQIKDLWEHGKRIYEFSQERKVPLVRLYEKLQSRGVIDDYALMKHEYCVIFLKWKKQFNEDDPVLSLNWKKLSHILMFSKPDNSVKDHALKYITSYPLSKLKSPEVSLLLQENLRRKEYVNKYSEEEQMKILDIRKKIKNKQTVDIYKLEEIVDIITNKKSDMPTGKNNDTNDL